MVLSNIQTGVKAEACSVLRCKCASVSKMQPRFLASKAGIFLALLISPFADCQIGMAIVVKSNIGEEPCMACYACRNDSIRWLEETQGHVTSELDVRWGCVSKITMRTPCSTTVAFRWLTKSGQCHLFPQICGWCAAWSLSNRSTPTICMHAWACR